MFTRDSTDLAFSFGSVFKTNPPCAYWPACLVPKRTPSTVRNPPPQLVRQTPQKQTHPKKNRPARWREGLRVTLCAMPTDLHASLQRELCRWSETHPHTWFAKCHKNKPTQKIYVCVLCLHYHSCCHKNKPTQKKTVRSDDGMD